MRLTSRSLRIGSLWVANLLLAPAILGCDCPPFLTPHEPVRVVLLEPYAVGGTFAGAEDWWRTQDPSVPSCANFDGLAETALVVVPGEHHGFGGEVCHVDAPLTLDAPVSITTESPNDPEVRGQRDVRPTFLGSDEVVVAGCSGHWALGLVPQLESSDADAGLSWGDPFRDATPGEVPPWLVVRSFESSSSCTIVPGFDEARLCSDVFAARLERIE